MYPCLESMETAKIILLYDDRLMFISKLAQGFVCIFSVYNLLGVRLKLQRVLGSVL